jgi:hypothetical protein
MAKVKLTKSLKKKVKGNLRVAFPVHLYWAWGDICVDYHVSSVKGRQTYMHVFPKDVAIMGGGISLVAARDHGKTFVFINEGDSVVVVEGEDRIYGLHNGLVYVIDDLEDVDYFFEGDFDFFELYSPFAREVEEVLEEV